MVLIEESSVSVATEAPYYALWVKLQIPGEHDPPCYYTISSVLCMEDDEPSLENLQNVVIQRLGDGKPFHQAPKLQYVDTDGDLIILPKGDDEAFCRALEQFPGKSLKIVALVANETEDQTRFTQSSRYCRASSVIKLYLEGAKKCRRISVSSILGDVKEGTVADPSLAKLMSLAAELIGDKEDNISLLYKTLDGEKATLLESDENLIDALDQVPQSQQHDQPQVLKVLVQLKSRKQRFHLVFEDQRLMIGTDVLLDQKNGNMRYAKLVAVARSSFASLSQSDRILLFYPTDSKKLPNLIRNDRDLQMALERNSKNMDLEIFCRKSRIYGFFRLAFVLLMGIALSLLPSLLQESGDSVSERIESIQEKEPEVTSKIQIREFILSPVEASLTGRYAQVRKHPEPFVAFYHKSNTARWELPNNHYTPGHYKAWTWVSRRGPGCNLLYAGITVEEADNSSGEKMVKTPFEYRQLMSYVEVDPTGSWSQFRRQYLGEFELTGTPGETLIIVADKNSPHVDFQGVSFKWVQSL